MNPTKIQFFQEQFHNSSASYTIFDKDWRITYANLASQKNCEAIFGRNMENEMSILTIVADEVGEVFRKNSRTALAGKSVESERFFKGKNDGKPYWLRFTYLPFYDNQEIVGVILKTENISEQVHHRNRFLLSKKIFANMSEGICLLDYEGKTLWCNQRHIELNDCNESFGLFRKEVLLLNQLTLEGILRQADKEGLWEGEVKTISPSGNPGYKRVRVLPFEDPGTSSDLTYIGITEDISETVFHKMETQEQKKTDMVTGSFNRAFLSKYIEEKIQENEPFIMANLDIDSFGSINRLKGYTFGDLLLRDFASRLQRHFPSAAIIRSHGDSFFLVAKKEGFEKLITSFMEPEYYTYLEINYSISCGVGLYPEHGKNIKEMIYHTELAMVQAKKEFGNSLVFYAPQDTEDQGLLDYIHYAMLSALDNKLFFLHYQPVFATTTGKIVGYEALIRWQDPDYGMIPPDKFIPIAEKGGLIRKITSFVLKQVAADFQDHPHLLKDAYVSVNISVIDLMGEELLHNLKDILRERPELTERIELEITETYFIDNFDIFSNKIRELRAMGIRIAIDDFGTGFSSLEKLVSIKYDRIKIDRTFVQRIFESPQDLVILETIVSLSKRLELAITAEGVETAEQMELLQKLGIHTMQGYYLAKPAPLGSQKL